MWKWLLGGAAAWFLLRPKSAGASQASTAVSSPPGAGLTTPYVAPTFTDARRGELASMLSAYLIASNVNTLDVSYSNGMYRLYRVTPAPAVQLASAALWRDFMVAIKPLLLGLIKGPGETFDANAVVEGMVGWESWEEESTSTVD